MRGSKGLVDRLRNYAAKWVEDSADKILIDEAADEIERLYALTVTQKGALDSIRSIANTTPINEQEGSER